MDLDDALERGDVDWDKAMDAILGAIRDADDAESRVDALAQNGLGKQLVTRELVFVGEKSPRARGSTSNAGLRTPRNNCDDDDDDDDNDDAESIDEADDEVNPGVGDEHAVNGDLDERRGRRAISPVGAKETATRSAAATWKTRVPENLPTRAAWRDYEAKAVPVPRRPAGSPSRHSSPQNSKSPRGANSPRPGGRRLREPAFDRTFSIASPQDSMTSRIANAYSPAFRLLGAKASNLRDFGPTRRRKRPRNATRGQNGAAGVPACAPQRKTFTLPDLDRTTRVLHLSSFDPGPGACGHARGNGHLPDYSCMLADAEWVAEEFAALNGRDPRGQTPAFLQIFSSIQAVSVEVPCQVSAYDAVQKLYSVRVSLQNDGSFAWKQCPRTILRFRNEKPSCFQERVRLADTLRFVHGMTWKLGRFLDGHPRQVEPYIPVDVADMGREESSRVWTFRQRITASALNFPLLREDTNGLQDDRNCSKSTSRLVVEDDGQCRLEREPSRPCVTLASMLAEMDRLLDVQRPASAKREGEKWQQRDAMQARVHELVDTIFTRLLPASRLTTTDEQAALADTTNHSTLLARGVSDQLETRAALQRLVEQAHSMLGEELWRVTEAHMHEAACAYNLFLSSKPARQLQRRRRKMMRSWRGTPEWARPRMLALHAVPVEDWRLRAMHKAQVLARESWENRTRKISVMAHVGFASARRALQSRALVCFDHLREYLFLAQHVGIELPSVLGQGGAQIDLFLGLADLAPPMRAASFTKKQSSHLQTVAHLLCSKWLHTIIMICLGKLQGQAGPDGAAYNFYTRDFDEYRGSPTERLVLRTRLVARQHLFEYVRLSLDRYVALFQEGSGFLTRASLHAPSAGRRMDVHLETCLALQTQPEGLFTVQLQFCEGALFQPALDEVRQRVLSTVEKLAHALMAIEDPSDDLVPVLAALRTISQDGPKNPSNKGKTPLIPLVLQSLMTIRRKRSVQAPIHYVFHRTLQPGAEDPFQFVADCIWSARCRLDAIVSESVAAAEEVLETMHALEAKILEGINTELVHIANLDFEVYRHWFTQPLVPRQGAKRSPVNDMATFISLATGNSPGPSANAGGALFSGAEKLPRSDSEESSLDWGGKELTPSSSSSSGASLTSSESSGLGQDAGESDASIPDELGMGGEGDFLCASGPKNEAEQDNIGAAITSESAKSSGGQRTYCAQDLAFREKDLFPMTLSDLEAGYRTSDAPRAETAMLESCEKEVCRLRKVAWTIESKLPSDVRIPLFQVESRQAKQNLTARCEEMAQVLLSEIHDQAMRSMHEAHAEYEKLLADMQVGIATADDLSTLWKFEVDLERILGRIWVRHLRPAYKRLDLLDRMQYVQDAESVRFQATLLAQPARARATCRACVEKAKSHESVFLVGLNAEKERFKEYLVKLHAQVEQLTAKDSIQDASQIAAETEYLNEAVATACSAMEVLTSRIRVFDRPEKEAVGVPLVKSKSTLDAERVLAEVLAIRARVGLYNQLWSIVADSREAVQAWRRAIFAVVDPDNVEELISGEEGWVRGLDALLEEFSGAEAGSALTLCLSTRAMLLEFKDNLPLLRLLNSKALRVRHWRQIVAVMVPLDGNFFAQLLGLAKDNGAGSDGEEGEAEKARDNTEDEDPASLESPANAGKNSRDDDSVAYDKVSLRILEDLGIARYHDEITEICALAEHEYEIECELDRMAAELHAHHLRTVKAGITAAHMLVLSIEHQASLGPVAEAASQEDAAGALEATSTSGTGHRDSGERPQASVAEGPPAEAAEGSTASNLSEDKRPRLGDAISGSLDMESIVRMIENQIIEMQRIQASAYTQSGNMMGRAEGWTKDITHLREWLESVRAFQTKWEPIEALFADVSADGSPMQLSEKEVKSFHFANRLWDQFTATVSSRRVSLHLLMDVLHGRRLNVAAELQQEQEFRVPALKLFHDLNECMDAINESLSGKLDEIRQRCPRFYFISDRQLLAFLSTAQKDLVMVAQRIGLLFDNACGLAFASERLQYGRPDGAAEKVLAQYRRNFQGGDGGPADTLTAAKEALEVHRMAVRAVSLPSTSPHGAFSLRDPITVAHILRDRVEGAEVTRRIPVDAWISTLDDHARTQFAQQVCELAIAMNSLDSWDPVLEAICSCSTLGILMAALRIACTRFVDSTLGSMDALYPDPALQTTKTAAFVKSTTLMCKHAHVRLDQERGVLQRLDEGIRRCCEALTAATGDFSRVHARVHAVITTLQDVRDRVSAAARKPLLWELAFRSYMTAALGAERPQESLRVETLGAHFAHGLAWDETENSRLVIAPATLRCLRALAVAAVGGLVGCAQGPSASGKSSTIRELAHLTGTRCIVVSTAMVAHVSAFARILEGLGATRAWALVEGLDALGRAHQTALHGWLQRTREQLSGPDSCRPAVFGTALSGAPLQRTLASDVRICHLEAADCAVVGSVLLMCKFSTLSVAECRQLGRELGVALRLIDGGAHWNLSVVIHVLRAAWQANASAVARTGAQQLGRGPRASLLSADLASSVVVSTLSGVRGLLANGLIQVMESRAEDLETAVEIVASVFGDQHEATKDAAQVMAGSSAPSQRRSRMRRKRTNLVLSHAPATTRASASSLGPLSTEAAAQRAQATRDKVLHILLTHALSRLGLKSQNSGLAPVCLDMLHASGVLSAGDAGARGVSTCAAERTGIFLIGPPGTGKSLAMRVLAEALTLLRGVHAVGVRLFTDARPTAVCEDVMKILAACGGDSASAKMRSSFVTFEDTRPRRTRVADARTAGNEDAAEPISRVFVGSAENEAAAAAISEAVKGLSWVVLDGSLAESPAAGLVEHLMEPASHAVCADPTAGGDRVLLPLRTSFVFETDSLAGVSPRLLGKCTLVRTDDGAVSFKDVLYAWLEAPRRANDANAEQDEKEDEEAEDQGPPALSLPGFFQPFKKRIEELCVAALPVLWALSRPQGRAFPALLMARLAVTVNALLVGFADRMVDGAGHVRQDVAPRVHVDAAVALGVIWTVGQQPGLDAGLVDAALRRVWGSRKRDAPAVGLDARIEAAILYGKDTRRSTRAGIKVPVELPGPKGLVQDFAYDIDEAAWVPWQKHARDAFDRVSRNEVRVLTAEQRRAAWFLVSQLAYRTDVLCTGSSHSGKRLVVEAAIDSFKTRNEATGTLGRRATTMHRMGLTRGSAPLSILAKLDRVRESCFAPPDFLSPGVMDSGRGLGAPICLVFVDDLALEDSGAASAQAQLRCALETGTTASLHGPGRVQFHGCSFVATAQAPRKPSAQSARLCARFGMLLHILDLEAEAVAAVFAPLIRRKYRNCGASSANSDADVGHEVPWSEALCALAGEVPKDGAVAVVDACKFLLRFVSKTPSLAETVLKVALTAFAAAVAQRTSAASPLELDHHMRAMINTGVNAVQEALPEAALSHLQDTLQSALCDDGLLVDEEAANANGVALSPSRRRSVYDSDEEKEEDEAAEAEAGDKEENKSETGEELVQDRTLGSRDDDCANRQELLAVTRDGAFAETVSLEICVDACAQRLPARLLARLVSGLEFSLVMTASTAGLECVVVEESSKVPSVRLLVVEEVARRLGYTIVSGEAQGSSERWREFLRDLVVEAGTRKNAKFLLYVDAATYREHEQVVEDVAQLARRGSVERLVEWSQLALGGEDIETDPAICARRRVVLARQDAANMTRGAYRSLAHEDFVRAVRKNLRVVVHTEDAKTLVAGLQCCRRVGIGRPTLGDLADLAVQVARCGAVHAAGGSEQGVVLISLFKRAAGETEPTLRVEDSVLEFCQVLFEIHSLATQDKANLLGDANHLLRFVWAASRHLVRSRASLQRRHAETEQALLMVDVASLFAVSMHSELGTLRPKLETAEVVFATASEAAAGLEQDLAVEQGKLDAELARWKEVDAEAKRLRGDISAAVDDIAPMLTSASEAIGKLARARIIEVRNLRNPNPATRSVLRALYLMSSGDSLEAREEEYRAELEQLEKACAARRESPEIAQQLRGELTERFSAKQYYWERALSSRLLDDSGLTSRLLGLQKDAIAEEIIEEVHRVLGTAVVCETFNVLVAADGTLSMGPGGRRKFVDCRPTLEIFVAWMLAVLRYRQVLRAVRPLQESLQRVTAEQGVLEMVCKEVQQTVKDVQQRLDAALKRRRDAESTCEQAQARIDSIEVKSQRAKHLQDVLGDDVKSAWQRELVQLRRKDEDDTADGTLAADSILVAACEVYLGSVSPGVRGACVAAWMEVLLDRGLRPSLSSGSRLVDWSGSHDPVHMAVDPGQTTSHGNSDDEDEDDEDEDLFDDEAESESALAVSLPGILASIPVDFGASDLRLFFPVGDVLDLTTGVDTCTAWLEASLPIHRPLIAQAHLLASVLEDNRAVLRGGAKGILPWSVRVPCVLDPDGAGMLWLRAYAECKQRRVLEVEACATAASLNAVFARAASGEMDALVVVRVASHESGLTASVISCAREYVGATLGPSWAKERAPFGLALVVQSDDASSVIADLGQWVTLFDFGIASSLDALTLGAVETLIRRAPNHLGNFPAWKTFATVHLSTLARKNNLHEVLMANLCARRKGDPGSLLLLGGVQGSSSSEATELLLGDGQVFEDVLSSGKDYLQVLQSYTIWKFERMGKLARMVRRAWPLAAFAARLYSRTKKYLRADGVAVASPLSYSVYMGTVVGGVADQLWADKSAAVPWTRLHYSMVQVERSTLRMVGPALDAIRYLGLQVLCVLELAFAERVRAEKQDSRAFVRTMVMSLFDGTQWKRRRRRESSASGGSSSPQNVNPRYRFPEQQRRRQGSSRSITGRGSTSGGRTTFRLDDLRRVTARLDLSAAAHRASTHVRRHSSISLSAADASLAAFLAIEPDYGPQARMSPMDWTRIMESLFGGSQARVEDVGSLVMASAEAVATVDTLQLKLAANPMQTLEAYLGAAKPALQDEWDALSKFVIVANACPSHLVHAARAFCWSAHGPQADLISARSKDEDSRRASTSAAAAERSPSRLLLRATSGTANRFSLRNLHFGQVSASSSSSLWPSSAAAHMLLECKTPGAVRNVIDAVAETIPIVVEQDGRSGVAAARQVIADAAQRKSGVQLYEIESADELFRGLPQLLSSPMPRESDAVWVVVDNPQCMTHEEGLEILQRLRTQREWLLCSSAASAGDESVDDSDDDEESDSDDASGGGEETQVRSLRVILLAQNAAREVPSAFLRAACVLDLNGTAHTQVNLGERFKAALQAWDRARNSLAPYSQLFRQVVLSSLFVHEVISCLHERPSEGARDDLVESLRLLEDGALGKVASTAEIMEEHDVQAKASASGMVLDLRSGLEGQGRQIDAQRWLLCVGELLEHHVAGRELLECAFQSSEFAVPQTAHGQYRYLTSATPWAKAYQVQVLGVQASTRAYAFSTGAAPEDVDRNDWFEVCGADATRDTRHLNAVSGQLRALVASALFEMPPNARHPSEEEKDETRREDDDKSVDEAAASIDKIAIPRMVVLEKAAQERRCAARMQLWRYVAQAARQRGCTVADLAMSARLGAADEHETWCDFSLPGVQLEGLRWFQRSGRLEGPYLAGKRSLGPFVFVKFGHSGPLRFDPFDCTEPAQTPTNGACQVRVRVLDAFGEEAFALRLPCDPSVAHWPMVAHVVLG